MKYYVNDLGDVFAFEADGSQDAGIKPGMRRIADNDVPTYLAAAEQRMYDALPNDQKRAMEMPPDSAATTAIQTGNLSKAAEVIDKIWQVRLKYPMTSEDTAENYVRTKRGILLAATDWTDLPSAPANARATWAEFRESLRNITTQAGFPQSVTWPAFPA